ncbi:MAG: molybdenum cofactor guanylyltransferase MobA [Gammaproteobacteria bacterium]
MYDQTKVTGVILAGGLARRMGGQDKGLLVYKRRPMLEYAIDAMQPVVGELLINANRNLDIYRQFGFTVLSDRNINFDGPLAGVLAALRYTQGQGVLLVMPCDSPLFKTEHLQRLLLTLQNRNAECCAAFDGIRLHPVFLAMQAGLADSLETFLNGGQRKIGLWLEQRCFVHADFSNIPEIFINVNTLQELAELERRDD